MAFGQTLQYTDLTDPENPESYEVSTDHKLPVQGTMTPAASELHLGEVGGSTRQVAPDALVVSVSPAYSVGDVVGGKLKFSGVFRTGGPGTGILQSLFLLDLRNQKPALELLLFNADPVAGTYTDNAACPSFLTNKADGLKMIRSISVATSDWVTKGSVATCDLSPGGRVLQAAAGVDLWGLLLVGGTSTPTFGATDDLVCRLGVLRD
jgi:hypothetical protein